MTAMVKTGLEPPLALMEAVLRDGAPLAPEYPLVFHPEAQGGCVALSDGATVQSACAVLPRDFVTPAGNVRIGLIGSVSTHPDFRRRGCATRLLAEAEASLARMGCTLSLLWGDDVMFYYKRGYRPIGYELDFRLSRDLIGRLPAKAVRAAKPSDARAIHALYATHELRVERSPRETELSLACPAMETLVVESGGRVCAYACRGRGRDLGSAIHEWGGETESVLALLRAHLERAPVGESLFLMVDPASRELAERLASLGVEGTSGFLGLAKVLDRRALAELLESRIRPRASVTIEGDVIELAGAGGHGALNDDMLLGLLFPPFGLCDANAELGDAFGLDVSGLPVGLFAWGLDSI